MLLLLAISVVASMAYWLAMRRAGRPDVTGSAD